MIAEVLPDIFKLKVPLPKNPLRFLNSYLIKGQERCLLIDTGFNWPECKDALVKAFHALDVDWHNVDFFVTHMHGDHSGLVSELATGEATVYCSKIDAQIIQTFASFTFWEKVNSYYIMHGYPVEDLTFRLDNIENFVSGTHINFTCIDEDDVLEYAGYHLVCVSTPGHSPGHMCLYEPQHRFFFGGDHILANITSNITGRPEAADALGQYLNSLDKVDAMDISLILPGHRELITDYHRRIAELKDHHEKRLQEILAILLIGPMTAYQVASRMHWALNYDTWDQVPSFQRWFATGEALAHLEYLVNNQVLTTRQDERLNFYESVI